MSTVSVISAVNQVRELRRQLPIQMMVQIVFETSTARWYVGRHQIDMHSTMFAGEILGINPYGCANRICQMINHQIVEECIGCVVFGQSTVIQITISVVGPCREFLQNVSSQTDRILC